MAYGNAELVLRETDPACHLSWATLAGIGRVESNHGRFGGAQLRDDGRPSKPIIGVPLDGSSGVKAIGDTDHGRYDGDPAVDRAVGPMQFIPSTWRKWGADANLDGVGDPQQIDDAALAAGRYLCAGGRDLSTPKGWWAAVFSYNNSVPYGQKVFGLADDYARAAGA
jgi:membrane-bound lytic murein transglycosylase B